MEVLLRLGDEYQMQSVLERCEAFLKNKVAQCSLSAGQLFDLLETASAYKLQTLIRDLIKKLSRKELREIQGGYDRPKIEAKLLLAIFDYKVAFRAKYKMFRMGHRRLVTRDFDDYSDEEEEEDLECAVCGQEPVNEYNVQHKVKGFEELIDVMKCENCKNFICDNCEDNECRNASMC